MLQPLLARKPATSATRPGRSSQDNVRIWVFRMGCLPPVSLIAETRRSTSASCRSIGWARRQQAEGTKLGGPRSEEHTSELQSLMRISYAVFCLKKKKQITTLNIREEFKISIQQNHTLNDDINKKLNRSKYINNKINISQQNRVIVK